LGGGWGVRGECCGDSSVAVDSLCGRRGVDGWPSGTGDSVSDRWGVDGEGLGPSRCLGVESVDG
jgi:hypothetical protein